MIKALFESIDKTAPEIKKLWIEMASLETPSADKSAVNRLVDLLSAFSARGGFQTAVHPFSNAGSGLVITYETGSAAQPVALMAHMDTVHKKGAFGPDPVTEAGDLLKGPGVLDCKGGIAVALLVMLALKSVDYRERSVKLILSPDEEVCALYSGDAGKEYLRKNIRGSEFSFNCESGSPQGNIVTGRKGVLRLQVNVRGKAAHAGSDYANGISAIKEAAHKIIHIEAESDPRNITYNCGIIHGGTIANSVPENCSFVVDIRYNNVASKSVAEAHIRRIAETSYIDGTVSTVDLISNRMPMEETPGNLALFAYVKDISAKYGLGNLRHYIAGGGSDSCYSVAEGVPSLCAMGIEGNFQHTPREQASISSLTRRAKLIAAAIMEYDGLEI